MWRLCQVYEFFCTPSVSYQQVHSKPQHTTIPPPPPRLKVSVSLLLTYFGWFLRRLAFALASTFLYEIKFPFMSECSVKEAHTLYMIYNPILSRFPLLFNSVVSRDY
jgi:hypothetical protein